jgi:hypothetical protein
MQNAVVAIWFRKDTFCFFTGQGRLKNNVPPRQFDSLLSVFRNIAKCTESATANRTAASGAAGDGNGLSHTNAGGIYGNQYQRFGEGAIAEHPIARAG